MWEWGGESYATVNQIAEQEHTNIYGVSRVMKLDMCCDNSGSRTHAYTCVDAEKEGICESFLFTINKLNKTPKAEG